MRGFRKELDSSEKLGESKGKTIPRNFTNQNKTRENTKATEEKERRRAEGI